MDDSGLLFETIGPTSMCREQFKPWLNADVLGILSAPSNLGLRPPSPGCVPGTAKAPEALREAGLFSRLIAEGAQDCGTLIAPRYEDDLVVGSRRVRNEEAILHYSRELAERITSIRERGLKPLVIGGDCSILLGAGLALAQAGRFALVHLDGHTDFRHPGNSARCGSLAGEDLAAVVGAHWPQISDIDGLGPYFEPELAVHVGCREDDEHLEEARRLLGGVFPSLNVERQGPLVTGTAILDRLPPDGVDGIWVQVDVDVVDPEYMPAVDSPDGGGFTPGTLIEILQVLLPHACGLSVTVFDPDLDPDGSHATNLAQWLVQALTGTADPNWPSRAVLPSGP